MTAVLTDTPALRARAESGDAAAQVVLAWSLLRGWVKPDAMQEAQRLVQSACAKNNTSALMLQMTLAALGFGRQASIAEACNLLARAADLGDKRAKLQMKALGKGKFDATPWATRPVLVQHAEAPRIYTVESFLPKRVCEWLIESRRGKTHPAYVYDAETGGTKLDPVRTNSVSELHTLEPDLPLQLTRMRIAQALGMPLANLEPPHVLRYRPGEEYRAHYDILLPHEAEMYAGQVAAMGQRAATLLIYLNDGYEGGETNFPHLDWRFKGKTGDALIFWNLSAGGEIERNSLHAGLPLVKGEKWMLSHWIRQKPLPIIDPNYDPNSANGDATGPIA